MPVRQCIRIPDLYEELRARERAGELEILPFETLSPALKKRIQQGAAKIILEKGLPTADTSFSQYMREKYPEGWSLAEQSQNL